VKLIDLFGHRKVEGVEMLLVLMVCGPDSRAACSVPMFHNIKEAGISPGEKLRLV
jgi:hypothetical protein